MILIKNTTIITMDDAGTLENSDILIKDGKISAIGENLSVDGAKVINAKGLYLCPGLIDAHSHMGGMDMRGQDLAESTDPIMPQVNVIHSININSPLFQYNLREGITTCCFVPGSHNVIAGAGIIAKTYGRTIYDMTIKNPAVMKCAMGENPKTALGGQGLPPKTRMGIASLLRGALLSASSYLEAKEAAGGDAGLLPPYDAKCEALIPVIRREIPLKVHCIDFDMLTIMDIAREFNCKYTIEHGYGCGKYVDELVEGGGSLMFGPSGGAEAFGELMGADLTQLCGLEEKGLNVCLITDSPIQGPETLLTMAGEAVRAGVPHMQALRMITINAAKGLGMDDRIGSIRVGKDADIALFDGIPALDMHAKVCCTIVNGEIAYRDVG